MLTKQQAENVLMVCDALESGKFDQCTGRLRKEECYCCLGVCCEVYRREHPHAARWDDRNDVFLLGSHATIYNTLLPNVVREWLGFPERSGPPTCTMKSASEANDRGLKTFAEIAASWREWVKENT